jgi:hypothetical protein
LSNMTAKYPNQSMGLFNSSLRQFCYSGIAHSSNCTVWTCELANLCGFDCWVKWNETKNDLKINVDWFTHWFNQYRSEQQTNNWMGRLLNFAQVWKIDW